MKDEIYVAMFILPLTVILTGYIIGELITDSLQELETFDATKCKYGVVFGYGDAECLEKEQQWTFTESWTEVEFTNSGAIIMQLPEELEKSEEAYHEGEIDLDKHMDDMAEFMKRECLDTWEIEEMPDVCLKYISGVSP